MTTRRRQSTSPRRAGTTTRAGRWPSARRSASNAAANWPYVRLMALWAFRYPAPTRSYPDYFTLVTPEFVAKPLYDALQTYTGN